MDKPTPHRYPTVNDRLVSKDPDTNSVGAAAIVSSLKHMKHYMDMPEALKSSLKMNQSDGFDCAGCAWPDPDDDRSSLGEYCENGIKALAEEATTAKADPAFFAKYSIDELSKMNEYELGKAGRITHPMVLRTGDTHYSPIQWDEAYAMIAEHLANIDPEEAVFYTSGRTSNEAAFMYGLLARKLGTNNLPDCSNMCHETSGAALSKVLGIGKGSVTLHDIYEADVILVMGQNPGTNHPRMLTALEKCKESGGKIIAVNPLREAGLIKYTNPQRPRKMLTGGTKLADLYLQVRINGDMALLKAIMYRLYERDQAGDSVFDHHFIKEHTSGYEDFIEGLAGIDYQGCLQQCGVADLEILDAVDLICRGKKMIICWAMGITQQANGVETIQEIVNLLLLRGSIGIKGGGVCPVRGHSNVQGDRTMGIWEKMPRAWLDRLGAAFDFTPPYEEGYATVPAIKAMHEGRVRFFMSMGGNFVSAAPDTDYCAEGLRMCDLTVSVSTKPNRGHLVHGKQSLILPVLGRSEIDVQESGYQFVSTENSMGIVQNSKGVLPPRSAELRSEVSVICGISHHLGVKKGWSIDWKSYAADYDLIRDKIEKVIPGFEDYNARVRLPMGFYLPNGVKNRTFNTETGKAMFTANDLPRIDLEAHQFQLGTVRSHDQYNTTLYGLDDRYRGIKNARDIVFMNPGDMNDLGLQSGDRVDIHSYFRGKRRSVYNFRVVPYHIPRRNLMAYFPEANPLVAIDHHHHITHTPVSKNIIVELGKSKS